MLCIQSNVTVAGPVKVYYEASRPVGFGDPSKIGTTFNRDVYTYFNSAPTADSPIFIRNTKLLIHEIEHVKQYESHGYNLASYGYRYLFQYCKAGFKYRQLAYEASAYTVQVRKEIWAKLSKHKLTRSV